MPTRPYYEQNAVTMAPSHTGTNLQRPGISHHQPSFHQQLVSEVMVVLLQESLAGKLVPSTTPLVASSTARLKITVCILVPVWITRNIVSLEASATAHPSSHQKRMFNTV